MTTNIEYNNKKLYLFKSSYCSNNNLDEIQAMLAYLKSNIEKYAQLNTQKLSERAANHD